MKTLKLPLFLLLLALIPGCGLFGSNPKAPSKAEQYAFQTITNYVQQPVQVTNVITKTIEVPVQVTNEQNIVVWITNEIRQVSQQVVWITNTVPTYTMSTSDTAKNVIQTGSGILNTFFPGIGSVVSSAVLALLAVWGHARSSKLGDTAAGIAQEVETMREFIKTLPQGTKYDAAITAFLQQHQVESGIANQVLNLLSKEVSNPEAKAAVLEIQNTLKTVSTP